MIVKIMDRLSKQIIECSVKKMEETETKTIYRMDYKKCNVCNISEYDQDFNNYKIFEVVCFKSGKIEIWAHFQTSKGNWTMGGFVVEADLISIN